MGFWQKVFNQVNPFDNGKTYKNPTGATAPQPQGRVVVPNNNPRVDYNQLVQAFNNKPIPIKPNQPVPAALQAIQLINKGLDSGQSWENISKSTGVPLELVQRYSKLSRPNYGIANKPAKQVTIGKTPDDPLSVVRNFVTSGAVEGAKNTTKIAASLPQAVAADIRGFQGKAPTQGQQQALQRGLTALNKTAAGKLTAPVQAAIDARIPTAAGASAAAGFSPQSSGIKKYVLDPATGALMGVGVATGVNAGTDIAEHLLNRAPSAASAMLETGKQASKRLRPVERKTLERYLDLRQGNLQNLSASKQADIIRDARAAAQRQLRSTQKVVQDISQPKTNPSLIKNILPQTPEQAVKTGTQLPERVLQQVDTPSMKTRGFVETIMNDPNTSPKVRNSISSVYKVRNTKELQTKAANLVRDNRDVATQLAANARDDNSVAVGAELIKQLQKEGNYTQAIEVANKMAQNLTEAGQTVQAASVYGRLTPEGILRFAQTEINKYNKLTGKNISLDPSQAEKLTKLAADIQKLPDGYEKTVALKKLVAEVQNTMPATLSQKLGTLQTMAQLLNPKTNIRNVGGNTIFAGLENISQTLATPIDKLLSFITGKRTTTLPNLGTQLKSGAQGLRTGVKEAYQGISTGPNTQFDLNEIPVFKGKILGGLEKTMNATLRGADRAAYSAAFDDSIRSQLKLAKATKVSPDMIEQAHQTALYRTFQDSNAISDFFSGMKKSLNKLGIGTEGKRFGLGDLALKYPKTPANLLARGIDYSPAGFVKSSFEVLKAMPPGKEFNQKAFVDAFSRAVVGSGSAFGMGYLLANNGIITAQPEQNKDLRNLQKTAGLGGYQINASAFKRWVLAGFSNDAAKIRPGDTLVSYDWAQPVAIPVSAGAALGTQKPQKAGQEASNTVLDSANTLVEQPLLQGVQKLFGGNNTGILDAAKQTIQSLPGSFTPTALSQINQLSDNVSRNTNDPNPVTESLNQVKAKIPGLAQTLPAQVDVLGNDKERYQNGSNSPFNVLLNPAFISKYKPNNTAQEGLDLYQRTGETKQTPNTVKNTVTINGQNKKLTAKEQGDYQRFVGQGTTTVYDTLTNDPRYQSLSDAQKINILSSMQTDLNNAAKIKLFSDAPAKVSESIQSILDDNISRAIELKLKAQDKASKPKSTRLKKSKAARAKIATRLKGKKTQKTSVRLGNIPKIRIGKAPTIKPVKARKRSFKTNISAAKPKAIKIKA